MIFEQIPILDQNYNHLTNLIESSQGINKTNQKIVYVNHQNGEKTNNFVLNSLNNAQPSFGRSSKMGQSAFEGSDKLKHESIKEKMLKPLQAIHDKKIEEKLKESIRIVDKKKLKKNSKISQLGS